MHVERAKEEAKTIRKKNPSNGPASDHTSRRLAITGILAMKYQISVHVWGGAKIGINKNKQEKFLQTEQRTISDASSVTWRPQARLATK